MNTDEGTQLIAKAQRLLDKKQYQRVLELLDHPDFYFESGATADRRMELVAVANVRMGRVQRGLKSLEWLVQRKPKSPVIMARYAEALAKVKESQRAALAILEDLEKKDLMPDADARAVLASLRGTARKS